jgi:hypothetical protein
MGEKMEDSAGLQEEHERIKAETEAQMIRSRVNDYIAIALALGAVLILWILQMMGLY